MNRRRHVGLARVLMVAATLPITALARADAPKSAAVVSPAATKAARVHAYHLSQQDEIDMAVIQDVQKSYFRGRKGSPSKVPCFLKIDGKDPGESLLRQVSVRIGPCQKFSACRQAQTGLFDEHGVFDRITGKAGVIFGVGAPKWLSDHEVIVSGYYVQARQMAGGADYHVIKKRSHWQIVQPKRGWVA